MRRRSRPEREFAADSNQSSSAFTYRRRSVRAGVSVANELSSRSRARFVLSVWRGCLPEVRGRRTKASEPQRCKIKGFVARAAGSLVAQRFPSAIDVFACSKFSRNRSTMPISLRHSSQGVPLRVIRWVRNRRKLAVKKISGLGPGPARNRITAWWQRGLGTVPSRGGSAESPAPLCLQPRAEPILLSGRLLFSVLLKFLVQFLRSLGASSETHSGELYHAVPSRNQSRQSFVFPFRYRPVRVHGRSVRGGRDG